MDCCRNKVTFADRIKAFLNPGEKVSQGAVQTRKVALVGSPNVGKSVIFNSLTGAYVTVSNYPGTTVDVSRGWFDADGNRVEVVDTPGMYSIMPISDEERVTRTLLMNEKPDLVVHVIDAKNIERMLPLTLQLVEAGFPVVLVLNIMDEAQSLGVQIQLDKLQELLGIPVISASAALNRGLDEIKKRIKEKVRNAA